MRPVQSGTNGPERMPERMASVPVSLGCKMDHDQSGKMTQQGLEMSLASFCFGCKKLINRNQTTNRQYNQKNEI